MARCPSCPTTETVRAIVFDEGLWLHVLAVALPLALLVVIAAIAYALSERSAGS